MTNTTPIILKNAPIINMGNIELPQVIYKGQPVLTARAVAEVLGTDRRDISRNFERNRDKYASGLHYFHITACEARELGFLQSAQKVGRQIVGLDFFRYSGSGMVLFTRRGLAKLSKSVGTPQAWAMMETFIDAYFTLEGMATGALSAQEGAQKAQEVVSKGAGLLPGIQMYSAGKNAPEGCGGTVNDIPKLLRDMVTKIETIVSSERVNKATLIEACNAQAKATAQRQAAEELADLERFKKACLTLTAERDEAREERDEAKRKVAELEAQLSFLRGSCVTRNTLQRALEKVLQEQGLE